jgi:beta-galactosidase
MIRFFFLVTILHIVCLPSHSQRVVQSINTNWQFHKGSVEDPATINDWEPVTLPHTWNAEDVNDDVPGYYRGDGWYRKIIYISPQWKNKKINLYFEGANQVTDVYVNGKIIGRHIGGYTAFSYPLQSGVVLNQSDTGIVANEILVRVNNSHNENIPPLSADFTFYGGIYRDVYLVATDPVHFNMDSPVSWGIHISTPIVTNNYADVNIKGAIDNQAAIPQQLIIRQSITDADGKIIATQDAALTAKAGERKEFSQSIRNIVRPNLWSPDSPYLYHVVSSIIDKKTKAVLDEITNPLGFRWFRFDANDGFFLNGKHLKLIGANRHQDYKGLGNAVPDELQIRDMELLKEMGANFIRISHYPQDPSVLDACDRLGLLVSEEIPIVNRITETDSFTNACLGMQWEMINQHFNHPSIIIWAYMNEVLISPRYDDKTEARENYFKHLATLAQKIEDLTRKEDSSRYTMIPNHGNWDLYNRVGITKIPKLVGWNLYQGWYGGKLEEFALFLDKHHRELPDKPLLVTEYGADADTRLHSFSPQAFDKTMEYTNLYHQVYQKAIADRPFVAGSAIWNLVEFNSEGRAESTPHVNSKGLLTQDRKPKDSYFYLQSQLLKKPFVRIGSRSWNRRAGIAEDENTLHCKQRVEFYSNQPIITVFLNGDRIDELSVKDGIAAMDVPFVSGMNKLQVSTGNAMDDVEIMFHLIPFNLKSSALPFTDIHVSLGDKRYYMDDATPTAWIPEQPYTKGSWGYIGGEVFTMKNNLTKYGSNKNILKTSADPIYQTQRVGIDSFKLDVPDGRYEVTLHFAELLSTKEREALLYNLNATESKDNFTERVFDVLVNGDLLQRLSNSTYLIPETAYNTKTITDVRNGMGITISFKAIKGQSILNGLEVRKL